MRYLLSSTARRLKALLCTPVSVAIPSVRLMSSKQITPFGSWKSPITSQLVAKSSIAFRGVLSDERNVFWAELRYEEKGRHVICSASHGSNEATEWTPKEYDARTTVHEYGGGQFFLVDGKVFFSNAKDQLLYLQETAQSEPRLVTVDGKGHRFADGYFCRKHNLIYIVREDHTAEGKEAENSITVIDPHTGKEQVLVSGNDFYSCPRVSPDGKHIVWVEWKHPNMPWDSTAIMLAELAPGGSGLIANSTRKVAGGEDISVMYPCWWDSNTLFYLSDESEWWNLYVWHCDEQKAKNVYPVEKEIGGPHWVFGGQPYALDPDRHRKRVVFDCGEEMLLLDWETGAVRPIATGATSHSYVVWNSPECAYCLAGGPTKFESLIRVKIDSLEVETIKASKVLDLDTGYISVPVAMSWPTAGGKTAHGYFYPPTNKDHEAANELPPLLVKAHGGPTAATSDVLNLKVQYFTSRGFGVLDVNYRGSTGYGKAYRNELLYNWGVCDVEDCCSGAQYLVAKGLADQKRLCIDGGSAGGYTTLACLAYKQVFSAGASHYGVSDLGSLAIDTHKFESRYLDRMIGPYPEKKDVYDARSPIYAVDQLSCPIVFFQGDEDKVVPPSQAETMYAALKNKNIPTAYILFEGEQHGFRKAENIQKALDGEFYFFARVYGFQPAEEPFKFPIDNFSN